MTTALSIIENTGNINELTVLRSTILDFVKWHRSEWKKSIQIKFLYNRIFCVVPRWSGISLFVLSLLNYASLFDLCQLTIRFTTFEVLENQLFVYILDSIYLIISWKEYKIHKELNNYKIPFYTHTLNHQPCTSKIIYPKIPLPIRESMVVKHEMKAV